MTEGAQDLPLIVLYSFVLLHSIVKKKQLKVIKRILDKIEHVHRVVALVGLIFFTTSFERRQLYGFTAIQHLLQNTFSGFLQIYRIVVSTSHKRGEYST